MPKMQTPAEAVLERLRDVGAKQDWAVPVEAIDATVSGWSSKDQGYVVVRFEDGAVTVFKTLDATGKLFPLLKKIR